MTFAVARRTPLAMGHPASSSQGPYQVAGACTIAGRTESIEANRMPDPGVTCVIGMHRSGTSAISRILNLMGLSPCGAETHALDR